jgi:hypothetical protein
MGSTISLDKKNNQLTNNVASAIARLLSTEKRLIRNGLEYAIAYNEQIIDMINRGIAKEINKERNGRTQRTCSIHTTP